MWVSYQIVDADQFFFVICVPENVKMCQKLLKNFNLKPYHQKILMKNQLNYFESCWKPLYTLPDDVGYTRALFFLNHYFCRPVSSYHPHHHMENFHICTKRKCRTLVDERPQLKTFWSLPLVHPSPPLSAISENRISIKLPALLESNIDIAMVRFAIQFLNYFASQPYMYTSCAAIKLPCVSR